MPSQQPQRRAVPLTDLDPELTGVSRRVIGAAIAVHKALGPGLSPAIYERALLVEMDADGEAPVATERGRVAPIEHRGHGVGELPLPLVVAERFIVEFRAERREIDGADRIAMRAMLRAADLELGLIINFGERRLKDGLVRVLNPDRLGSAAPEGDRGDA